MIEQWKCKCGTTVRVECYATRHRCWECGEHREECEAKRVSEPTTDITPTEADMRVDLAMMLDNLERQIVWLNGQSKREGAVFSPQDIARAYAGTVSAIRRALHAEAILNAPREMLFADGREPTKNERHLINLLSWREKEAREAKAELEVLRLSENARLAAAEARVKDLLDLLREVQQKLIRDSDWAGPSAPSYVLISDYIRREMGQKIEEVIK